MAHRTIRKTTSHIRSSSWPAIASHPLDSTEVEFLLHKLTTSVVETSSSSSSSKFICNNLIDIKNLYEGINNLIQCSMNQKVLSNEEHQRSMENVLEGSLALLDATSCINDVLSLMKQSIVELQSCLRRKSGDEQQAKAIDSYMISRKKIQKIANKCLKSLHKTNMALKDVTTNTSTNTNTNTNTSNKASILRMISEAEIVSFSKLKSILTYFSDSPTNNKGKSWSLMMSKLRMNSNKQVSNEKDQEEDVNEIVKMDNSIFAFEDKKTSIDGKIKMSQDLLKQLAALEVSVQEIEGSLESISRCLLRTRVSLLNIISQ